MLQEIKQENTKEWTNIPRSLVLYQNAFACYHGLMFLYAVVHASLCFLFCIVLCYRSVQNWTVSGAVEESNLFLNVGSA